MPTRRPYERIVEDLISACRKHVVAATGSSPFKVRDNQRPERTGEVGGINCGGDMGVRRCLARSLTSLALMRTPKSANGPRSNSFRPDSPSTTNFPRGRKTQPAPSPHRTWSVPDASSQPQLNLHLIQLCIQLIPVIHDFVFVFFQIVKIKLLHPKRIFRRKAA